MKFDLSKIAKLFTLFLAAILSTLALADNNNYCESVDLNTDPSFPKLESGQLFGTCYAYAPAMAITYALRKKGILSDSEHIDHLQLAYDLSVPRKRDGLDIDSSVNEEIPLKPFYDFEKGKFIFEAGSYYYLKDLTDLWVVENSGESFASHLNKLDFDYDHLGKNATSQKVFYQLMFDLYGKRGAIKDLSVTYATKERLEREIYLPVNDATTVAGVPTTQEMVYLHDLKLQEEADQFLMGLVEDLFKVKSGEEEMTSLLQAFFRYYKKDFYFEGRGNFSKNDIMAYHLENIFNYMASTSHHRSINYRKNIAEEQFLTKQGNDFAIKRINSILQKGHPVTLSVNYDKIKKNIRGNNGTDINHIMAIVGQKMIDGKCHYLVRPNYANCKSYSKNYAIGTCHNQHDIWFPRQLINSNTYSQRAFY